MEKPRVMVDGRLLVEKMPTDCNLYRMRVPIKAVQINEPFTFRTKGGMFKAKTGDFFLWIENAMQSIIYKLEIGFHALDEKLFLSLYEEVAYAKPVVTTTKVVMKERELPAFKGGGSNGQEKESPEKPKEEISPEGEEKPVKETV